jgi:probable F420-dependent oxidoreductase
MTLFRLPTLVGESLDPWMRLARLADERGIDQISVPDHIVFVAGAEHGYPLGADKFPSPLDESWPEPLTVLAGMAGCTSRIRLSTSVLVAPLRSAVGLAKTLATLDVLSNGRLDAVFGGGWQEKEFEACNMPFEGRMGHMDEQAEICRLLWSRSPASFAGKFNRFENVYCRPFPVQKPGIPIWLGVKVTPANLRRIARYADGWLPAYPTPDSVRDGFSRIRAALIAEGRDPASFEVRAAMMPLYRDDRSIDLDATFDQAQPLVDAGATVLDAGSFLASREADLPEIIERLVDIRTRYN